MFIYILHESRVIFCLGTLIVIWQVEYEALATCDDIHVCENSDQYTFML